MLSLLFQFQKPISCLHKPFLNAPFQTIPHLTRTHNGNNNLSNIGFMMSQSKHCVLSIGSTGFHESPSLSKDMVPSVEFGLSKEEEEEEYVDDEKEEEYAEGSENFDTSFVSMKDLPPWGELEEEEEEEDDDDDDDEGREVDTPFVPKMDLPPLGEVESDDDDDDVDGREEIDTSFVGKKDLPPWGEVEDFGCRDLSASKEMGLMNEHRALFLEETDENVLSNRILVLSRTNKIRSAMEYFRSMELSGLCPNIHACNSLISSLLRNGRLDDCFKVFNFTRTRKITTGHTYSLILLGPKILQRTRK